MKVESREYKLLVNHEPFADPSDAVHTVWDQTEDAAKTLAMVRTKGRFDEKESRSIIFLDTPDHTLRRNGFVLRRRAAEKAAEYTLKCRSEDRYFAAGTDVGAAEGLDGVTKLEEDIAPPFICRFSHSTTVTAAAKSDIASDKAPNTLREAASLFRVLGAVQVDGRSCAPETALEVVNSITVHECVWTGDKIVFDRDDEANSEKATVALILWTRGSADRPAVAELSFRVKDREER